MDIKRKEDITHKLPSGRSEDNYHYALSDKIFHTKQLFVYSEKVQAGKKSSAPHFHSAIDEVIYVTKGELSAYEGNDSVILKEGDSICFYAKSNEKHYLENKSKDDAEFLIIRRSIPNDDVVY